MSGNNDDEKLPEVARRRGNADTLFSADWFDDEDEGDGDAAPKEDAAPSISAPAMYEPPAPAVKPSSPPAAPPPAPPPPKRLSNPTILPDFDMDDDEPAPPPVVAPKPSAPQAPADDALPDVAKRRGNADTLFSADWFDDDEKADADKGGAKPAEAPKPTSSPVSKAAAAEPEATGGNRTLMLVAAGGILLFLACAGIGTGLGIVMLMKG